MGRVFRYGPILGALLLGIAAGIEIASRYRAPVLVKAQTTAGLQPLGSLFHRDEATNSPVQSTRPVFTALPRALQSAPASPVAQGTADGNARANVLLEKAPPVERSARTLDFAALQTASAKPKASAMTATAAPLAPPLPVNVNSVPQIPSWTALPRTTFAAPAPAPAKIIAPSQRTVTPVVIPVIPLAARSVGLQVLDPQPLRKVMPGKTSSALTLYGDLDVKIKVTVGTDGRVTAAQPVASSENIDQSRKSAALLAAQQWLFRPATLRGQAIESEYIIVFRFHARQ